MLKRNFVNRLRKLGEIPIPEGHARVNKGVTTYFFTQDKMYAVEKLLTECGLTYRQPVKRYHMPTSQWVRVGATGYLSNDVMVATNEQNLFVSIVRWES